MSCSSMSPVRTGSRVSAVVIGGLAPMNAFVRLKWCMFSVRCTSTDQSEGVDPIFCKLSYRVVSFS